MGIEVIIEQLDELVPLGLSSVLLFPVLDGSDTLKVKLSIDHEAFTPFLNYEGLELD